MFNITFVQLFIEVEVTVSHQILVFQDAQYGKGEGVWKTSETGEISQFFS